MTTLPVNDLGLKIPMVNEAGGTPPANGKDFMNKFKSAVETQATAMNIAPAPSETSDSAPVQPKERNVDNVNKTEKASPDKEDVDNSIKKDTAKAEKNDVSTKDSKEPGEMTEEVKPEIVETIAEAAQQIIDQVAQELNVSPEEVINAIEENGLTMADLLDPAKMTELVTTLSGNQDTVTLLTDENLYQTLGELQEFVTEVKADLTDKLDLSQEALNEVLAQTEELNGPMQMNEIAPKPPVEEQPVLNEGQPLEGMKDFKVTTQINGETVSMDVKVDDATGSQAVTNISRESAPQSDSGEPSYEGRGQQKNDNDASEAPVFTQTVQFNNDINTQNFTAATDEVTSFRTEASDIANQIMDNMRANLSQEVTELEMNLHPASLGSVRVNLQSQNGQITAQFFAQDESVRAAIESQVTQLRESLEAQGIKIEQVEVAVASQGFDRNRDNSQGQGDNPDQGRPGNRIGRGGRVRKIDLNAMEGEEAEEMEEADRITAEMMASAGNTVDYMA